MMKFKRQQIKINCKKKIETVDANVNGVWAYHKSLNYGDRYTVTHIPTSLAVYYCITVKEARHLIERLSKVSMHGNRFTLADSKEYSKAKHKINTAVGKWAEKILKPIVFDHKENYWKEQAGRQVK